VATGLLSGLCSPRSPLLLSLPLASLPLLLPLPFLLLVLLLSLLEGPSSELRCGCCHFSSCESSPLSLRAVPEGMGPSPSPSTMY
jgi:hypothetical protein